MTHTRQPVDATFTVTVTLDPAASDENNALSILNGIAAMPHDGVLAATSTLPWRRVLDVSTDHITSDDAQTLDAQAEDGEFAWPVRFVDEFGYLIYVGGSGSQTDIDARVAGLVASGLPSIAVVAAFAGKAGADYVLIDSNAPTIDGLPHVWAD
jgi:hypothetical protein